MLKGSHLLYVKHNFMIFKHVTDDDCNIVEVDGHHVIIDGDHVIIDGDDDYVDDDDHQSYDGW